MTYETITVQIDDRGVAYLTLNAPEKRNAISAQMITELHDFATGIGAKLETRAVVLSGAGKMFCAGGDLNWMKAQMDADRETRMKEARRFANMLRALNEMPTPMIGRIHGSAFGGGVGLACICDIAFAEEGTKFGLMESRLGLNPATIGPYVVARLGEGMARRVFMSARVFDHAEAREIGLIAEAAPVDQLDVVAEKYVLPYLSVAPGAVGSSKKLARFLGPRIDDEVIEATIKQLADRWETEEAREGIEAFLAKRPPRWAVPGQ
ncbi:MAG: crotonase/enoyl-CoA hydratase family protein [Hyphomicrobiales bacterium]|nr:crotonase/enoyl-CoA hydratase family protein [Hyphomicrobiales bacterium]